MPVKFANKETPLLIALKKKQNDIVGYLIKNRAALNSKDSNGTSPLHFIFSNNLTTVENVKGALVDRLGSEGLKREEQKFKSKKLKETIFSYFKEEESFGIDSITDSHLFGLSKSGSVVSLKDQDKILPQQENKKSLVHKLSGDVKMAELPSFAIKKENEIRELRGLDESEIKAGPLPWDVHCDDKINKNSVYYDQKASRLQQQIQILSNKLKDIEMVILKEFLGHSEEQQQAANETGRSQNQRQKKQ